MLHRYIPDDILLAVNDEASHAWGIPDRSIADRAHLYGETACFEVSYAGIEPVSDKTRPS